MMREILILFAILGAYPLIATSQDSKPIGKKPATRLSVSTETVDTVIFLPDGSITRSFYSISSANSDGDDDGVWGLPASGVRRNFKQSQQQILRQYGEQVNELSAWMEQQAALRDEKVRQYWKEQKNALFISVMGLTPDEAERFWPLYNEFSAKRDEIVAKRQQINNKLRKANLSISDKEAEELSRECINSMIQETGLQQEYYRKYKAVLAPNKLLMIYKAEDAFKLMMLQNRGQILD